MGVFFGGDGVCVWRGVARCVLFKKCGSASLSYGSLRFQAATH